ncbi:aminoacyl-tRNA hydrolase [Laedolimicola ammoniilytica]|uniref:Peptidyl-tRNA hydrolase n=1 Tax=Laedolimicola ammoniilytica TaxID=2981771 RepID=A0ABT2RVL6_9FIRM|nr:aminoacyl-tRNA hydrolase [Laedolimicola ammoniilytica]MCU6696363.1 aminoacyl-tRNA hydrolase [Laedolimicola ammoniilytica]SCH60832.1 Peptidyl-tRNA hydrolase [uncultured Clostridium sp.]
MYIIAGLGNPTAQYDHTRHNIGFDTITYLADRYHISMNTKKFQAICGTGIIEGQKVLLLKPQTYMNLSGNSIGEAVNFYKLDPATEVIVIYDDIALEPGYIRVRKKGSAGGHNGIKDIIAHLGTQEFKRVRVGVGEKPKDYDLAAYVLGHFTQEDRQKVEEAIAQAADAVELMVQDRTDEAMNLYNKKKHE